MTVHITPNANGSYFVSGSTTALRRFSNGDLGIHTHQVDAAMEALRRGGTHPIPHVMLTAEQIKVHGLGPV